MVEMDGDEKIAAERLRIYITYQIALALCVWCVWRCVDWS